MGIFQKILKKIIGYLVNMNLSINRRNENNILLCSNCFRDEGLRLDAFLIGIKDNKNCPKCNSNNGSKLTKNSVRKLCYRFFVRGTIPKLEYGGSPIIQYNENSFNKTNIRVSTWLEKDVKLIEEAGEIGLFYYGPRFWMLGEVEPLKSLQNDLERDKIIDKILKIYPVRELTETDHFYRIRCNPKIPHDLFEYDTAPDSFLGKNRFDSVGFPVLYGSTDLELCIHECRVTVEDSIFVGKLIPTKKLKILDLSELLEDGLNEFESLDIAIHFLFLAGKHSYDICRQIAIKAKEEGFDGIIYPSYFSFFKTGAIPFETIYGVSIRIYPHMKEYAKSQIIPNLALFGRPIKDNKIKVYCINKVIINKISYDLTFGPAIIEE